MRAFGIIFSNIHDANVPELSAIRTMASIPFGGRYRLIDFALSNMVNSGIDTVGVITKRNYQSLMDHVGSGKDWDLARKDGGLIFLPPFGDEVNDKLYESRLEALKGVLNFITRADEEYAVLTDCDGICRVDYDQVISSHIEHNADITMIYTKHKASALPEHNVNTLSVKKDGFVEDVGFERTLKDDADVFINMYVLKRTLLINLLNESISKNSHHFIEDVIREHLRSLKIYGYEHKGYYARISSLQSYFIYSRELLDDDIRNELFGDRGVLTKIRDSAPTKYGFNSIVKNSMIADGCIIEGEVENSVLFRGVKVARGTKVKNCILMQNTKVGEGVTLNCIITDKNVIIGDKEVLSGSENHPFYLAKGTFV